MPLYKNASDELLCIHNTCVPWTGRVSLWVVMEVQIHQRLCSHNERDRVSNHLCLDCLLYRLFRYRSKNASKLCVTCLCEENSPVTSEFLAGMASNAEMFPADDVILRQVTIHYSNIREKEPIIVLRHLLRANNNGYYGNIGEISPSDIFFFHLNKPIQKKFEITGFSANFIVSIKFWRSIYRQALMHDKCMIHFAWCFITRFR